MRLTSNADEVALSIFKLEKEVARKLEGMVRRFVHIITMTAIDYTPIGNAVNYSQWYQMRTTNPKWQSYGLDPIEGFAKGSWRVDMDGVLSVQEYYGKTSEKQASDRALQDLNDYKLGDIVMISNMGPYIQQLDNNYSKQTHGQGILQHTVDSTMRTYQLHLDDYYQKA